MFLRGGSSVLFISALTVSDREVYTLWLYSLLVEVIEGLDLGGVRVTYNSVFASIVFWISVCKHCVMHQHTSMQSSTFQAASQDHCTGTGILLSPTEGYTCSRWFQPEGRRLISQTLPAPGITAICSQGDARAGAMPLIKDVIFLFTYLSSTCLPISQCTIPLHSYLLRHLSISLYTSITLLLGTVLSCKCGVVLSNAGCSLRGNPRAGRSAGGPEGVALAGPFLLKTLLLLLLPYPHYRHYIEKCVFLFASTNACLKIAQSNL